MLVIDYKVMEKYRYDVLKSQDLKKLDYEDFSFFINCDGNAQLELFELAKKKQVKNFGNNVFVRGVIELSNKCRNDCNYCSMNSSNSSLKRYTISFKELKRCVDYGIKMGLKTFHLSSGETSDLNESMLIEMIKYIVDKGCKVILVIGKRSYAELLNFYKAGAETFISKFETSNSWLYSEYNNKNGSLEFRLEYLNMLKEIGYKIGTGNIVGLPFQSDAVLYEDLKLMQNIRPDQASTSRFVSNSYSKYSKYSSGDINKTKNYIALMRIFLEDKIIIPTNSSIGIKQKFSMLQYGANLISINLTPKEIYKNYVIYNDETRYRMEVEECKKYLEELNLNLKYEF